MDGETASSEELSGVADTETGRQNDAATMDFEAHYVLCVLHTDSEVSECDEENDDTELTPLAIVSSVGPPDVVKAILEASPEAVTIPDQCGALPIHRVVLYHRNDADAEAVARMLKDADPKTLFSKDQRGNTPLMCAVDSPQGLPSLEMVKILLGDGKVDPTLVANSEDMEGRKALDIVSSGSTTCKDEKLKQDIVEMLELLEKYDESSYQSPRQPPAQSYNSDDASGYFTAESDLEKEEDKAAWSEGLLGMADVETGRRQNDTTTTDVEPHYAPCVSINDNEISNWLGVLDACENEQQLAVTTLSKKRSSRNSEGKRAELAAMEKRRFGVKVALMLVVSLGLLGGGLYWRFSLKGGTRRRLFSSAGTRRAPLPLDEGAVHGSEISGRVGHTRRV